ncbi:MAG: AAA family ATPase [Polyangiaceae bacterium]|nr:AAA family ATPase [Polyangiaceae bacterium]
MTRENDVPQATLDRVRSVVDACAAGAADPEALAGITGISRRHVAYAVAAARTLDLLVLAEDDGLNVTEAGKALAATTRGGEEERVVFRDAIGQSRKLRDVAGDLLGEREPDRAALAARLRRRAGLSAGTAGHRAAMLLVWRRKLLSPQMRLPEPRLRMWRRVEITNFRSIEHAVVDLAPFTVVVGPNGSGKSNFADALVFARDMAEDASGAIAQRGGIVGVRRWRPSKPTDVAIDVRAARSRNMLERTYVRHAFKLHSELGGWSFSKETIEVVDAERRTAYFDRHRDRCTSKPTLPEPTRTLSAMFYARQAPAFKKTAPLRNVRCYRLNPQKMREPQMSVERKRLLENGENIAAVVGALAAAGPGRIRPIVEVMSKIIPRLENISVDTVGRYQTLKFWQVQAEGVAPAELNATEMSEGAIRALGIVVAASQMEADELVVIEEPEVSIHVGAARLIFEVLKEASERGAVLLTTHSADLLDAARDEEILVCEYADGVTQIGPLDRAQRRAVRDGLFSLAELMRSEPLRIARPGNVRDRPDGTAS